MPKFDARHIRTAYRITATVILVGTALALIALGRSPNLLHETLGAAGVSVTVAGKFIILYGFDEGSHLGPFGLALMVFTVDMVIAVVLTSGARWLELIPGFGRWLSYLRMRANRALAENPGLSNMAFFGVVLYVFIPLAATGAVTGTLAARILGLSRFAGLMAVALGSASISTLFALVAYFGKQHSAALGPKMTALSLAIVAGLAWLVIRRVRRILQQEN